MFKRHRHNFTKEGNNLWCACGKNKRLRCDHQWSVHSSNKIITEAGAIQILQILICEICGIMKAVNTITGQI